MKDDKIEEIIYQIYEIKVEVTVPTSLVYRIRSDSADNALKEIDKHHPVQSQPHFSKKKMIKATVYSPPGTLTIKATKLYK